MQKRDTHKVEQAEMDAIKLLRIMLRQKVPTMTMPVKNKARECRRGKMYQSSSNVGP